MITIPAKAKERLAAGVKRFQPILRSAMAKDINESDTVTIVADMLSEIFGYDKYTEVTSEFAIKKTFCDLAVQLDGRPCMLIEVKSINANLKEQYIKQATDYGANSGVDWVVLTSGAHWMVYRIGFGKPVTNELVYEFSVPDLNLKRQSDLELLYYLCREAMVKSSKVSIEDYHAQKQVTNKYTIGQLILTDPVLDVLRRQISKLSSAAKVSNDEIAQIITEEVLKREVLEGDKAADAKKRVAKEQKAQEKAKSKPAAPAPAEDSAE